MLTRSESVTDRLRQQVLEGEYLPGSRLQEVQLAETMGVSRTPVRAALAALEKEGLLTYIAKRGYEVRRFLPAEIADMYQVRSVLEGNAAALCARNGISDEQVAELRRCLMQGDEILAKGHLDPADLPVYRDLNGRLHSAIIAGSGSAVTAHHVRQICQIPFLSDRVILWESFALINRSHDDHHRVVDAIVERDPQRADAIMREHVTFMGRVVLAFLTKSSFAQVKAR
ncbi:GntR family transcriptional regulator [Rhodoligotrophos ferricapiens]|uniref:GntR family transcriptional regulator n=1 Tax=Rhodoligotrophos ferricapiens TaxID=3069264 RepID=UPI00315D9636